MVKSTGVDWLPLTQKEYMPHQHFNLAFIDFYKFVLMVVNMLLIETGWTDRFYLYLTVIFFSPLFLYIKINDNVKPFKHIDFSLSYGSKIILTELSCNNQNTGHSQQGFDVQ